MKNLGFHVSTVHEFQGKQAAHIAVVRTTKNIQDIYTSVPHCLVAISRHRRHPSYKDHFDQELFTIYQRTTKLQTKILYMNRLKSKSPTRQEIQNEQTTVITANFTKENSLDILFSPQLPRSSNKFKTTLSPPITAKKTKIQ